MAREEPEEDAGRIQPKYKALGVALLVNLVCLPLVLVLVYVWPLVILAIVPYIAGSLGGKYVDRRTGTFMGALAAGIMVTVLIILFIVVLIRIFGEDFTFWEPIGLSIVALAFLTAVIFGALGGRHGATVAEESRD
jgi:hypothetical protein